jgi:ribulose-phosphate 3-epimerase
MAEIIPAILSENLEDYILFAEKFSKFSSHIHLDFMDGIYVEKTSPTLHEILDEIGNIDVKKSIHLMHKQPELVLDLLNSNHVETVYVHADTINAETLNIFPELKIGIVLNPDHKVADYFNLIEKATVVMIMAIEPGMQGTEFLPETLLKINQLRDMGYDGEIHIDGHVNESTILSILDYKPDVLNVGSAIQLSDNPAESYLRLKKLAEG